MPSSGGGGAVVRTLLLGAAALALAVRGGDAASSHIDEGTGIVSYLDGPPEGVDPAFDCKWRALAYKYAQQIQPHRGSHQSVFDALQLGAVCNATPTQDARPRMSEATLRAYEGHDAVKAGSAFFADPVHGSDSNPGTEAKPFKTVGAALKAARAAPKPAAITLRAGTFFLAETLQLTAADSGISFAAYKGETPVISGGADLAVAWKPYNVSTNVTWEVVQNENAVYAAPEGPNVHWAGKQPSAAACEAACKTDGRCNVWTWHDSHQGTYANDCAYRYDGKWSLVAQTGHTSGRKGAVKNVWVADLSGQGVTDIPGLFVDGQRAIRAKYPNSNPETDLFPTGWITDKTTWAKPRSPTSTVKWVTDSTPVRNESFMFLNYMVGFDGACEVYSPPLSYWCSQHPSGGGAFAFRVPSGLTYSASTLPNAPYASGAPGALLAVWRPAHWASWFFEADAYDAAARTIGWTKGGFQGARGDNSGGEWYISNVFEELDWPTEYFFDAAASKLYYFHNATAGTAPPASVTFAAARLKTLVNLAGTKAAPVKGVSFTGITFTGAAATFMDPHGVPSGGDWALQRAGAFFMEGTEGVSITGCTFTNLDGNGLFISGYTRGAAVADNEFVWIGDSAIASWGYTVQQPNASAPTLPTGTGIDGTTGIHPEGTTLTGNLIHELGLYAKQNSCYFQAKTAKTTLHNNICFNGPRAGVNFNDGFGGGNVLSQNLLFNMCRESGDHGPFNSWDRQPFLTLVGDGKTPSLVPAWNTIENNFMVANYGANGGCIDNDDGSSWYRITDNFFVFGGHKSDFGGHSKLSYGNLNAYANVYGERCVMLQQLPYPGENEGYWNNTCVLATAGDKYLDIGGSCSTANKTAFAFTVHDNTVYVPGGQTSVQCGGDIAMDKWAATGLDPGTTVHDYASISAQDVVDWAAKLLGMPASA